MDGPRERTRQHMQRLLTAAAASAALVACGQKGTGGSGYGVVDPMPPPARCPGLAELIKVQASWKTEGARSFVEVLLDAPADRDVVFSTEVQDATATIGPDGKQLVLQVQPAEGRTTQDLGIHLTCSTDNWVMTLHLEHGVDGGPVVAQLRQ